MTENNFSPSEEIVVQKKSYFFLYFLLLAVLLLGLTGLLIFSKKQNTVTTISNNSLVTPTPTPQIPVNKQTLLFLSTPIGQIVIGSTVQIPILVSTASGLGQNNKLSALQFNLNFDPKVLQVQDLVAGDFFTSPTVLLKTIDNQKGQISYALGSLNSQSGNKTLATLSVKLISASSQTQISFSQVKAADVNQGSNNVIKETKGLTLTIK